jgi:hypothetical protein
MPSEFGKHGRYWDKADLFFKKLEGRGRLVPLVREGGDGASGWKTRPDILVRSNAQILNAHRFSSLCLQQSVRGLALARGVHAASTYLPVGLRISNWHLEAGGDFGL